MRLTTIGKSTAALAASVLLLGSECGDSVSPPPARALYPSGTVERGPFYSAFMTNGTDYMSHALDADAVTITPMEGVTYDTTTKRFQFRALGTYVITTKNETPALTSTLTVVEAPTVIFDMVVNGNRDIYSASIYGFNLQRWTTDPADEGWPSVAKGTLVFTSYRSGNAELYSKPLVTSAAETRLTVTEGSETEAQLSPNGERLAFVREEGGVRHIWLSGADGTNAQRLSNASPTIVEGHPRWYLSSDYLLLTSTASGGTAIYRSPAIAGSTPTLFAAPVTADSIYDDPDVRSMTSANFAVGGLHWIASVPGGPRRALMASVYYNGTRATEPWIATPSTESVSEPAILAGTARTAFVRLMPDGSTTLGWIEMTAPFTAFDSRWHQIPLSGVSPRHPSAVPNK